MLVESQLRQPIPNTVLVLSETVLVIVIESRMRSQNTNLIMTDSLYLAFRSNACDFSRSLNGQKTSGSDYEHEHRDAEHEHEEELRQTNSNVFLE